MTDLLHETELDTRQRDYAQTVRNSGEALLAIIDDILDFSKIEAGRLEIEDVEFTVRTILEDVVDLLAGAAQAKGLELVGVVESAVPTVVSGDPGRLRQVLTNFIGNAIKFTPAGEIVVRVTKSDPPGVDSVVRFEVSDTGVGVAPDKLGVIFQSFVQADTSTSRRYGGTGLGLAISSQLVSLMGGECGVSSRLGVGSTFWFTISVHAASGQPTLPGAPDAELVGVSVLVVDDNATQRSVLSECLTNWGMTVVTAESGEVALSALQTAADDARPFAVALLDRAMPGLDGLDLKTAIVGDPAVDTRLVLMTGVGRERDLGAADRAGFSAVLSKPVHAEHLLACIRVALGLQTANVAPMAPPARPSPAGSLEAGRLLLAEDNLINQKVAVAMLSSGGYQVDTVMNGVAAVQAAATQRYDAILMDCQMPELNGYEATAAIRALEGALRHTPIIAMTAGARREDRDRCLTEGMDGYLAKPISKDALLALVARSVQAGPGIAFAPPTVRKVRGRESVLDRAVFGELLGLGEADKEGFLTDLIGQFVSDTEQRLVELRHALEDGDILALARIAHDINGAGGQLGGRRLASSCSRLEAKVAAGSRTDRKIDVDAVEADYRELCGVLQDELSALARQRLHVAHG
jgi:CheY-like chemotaxis protein/HPt (histidine-containing phosphotransfer) domain-containing protein